MTGETKRVFFKHKLYGSLHAVEIDEKGEILAAVAVAASTACPHELDGDYELVEPVCSDPTHLLADIGVAEKECAAAESEFEAAHRHAASLKKIFESKQARLREIVRGATDPKPMPLFAGAAD